MASVRAWLFEHKRLALILALALLVPVLTVSAVDRDSRLYVAANAPQNGRDLVVLVGVDQSLTGSCDGIAEIEIELDGIIVYPAVFTKVPLNNCQGSVEIPYNKFVLDNAQYLVRARWANQEAETYVFVEKYVHWVFVRSFSDPQESRARIDVAFDSIKGQPLVSGIFAVGTLVLDVRWETCRPQDIAGIALPISAESCRANGDLVFHAEVPVEDRASTHVFIPYAALESEKWDERGAPEGWYNVTATFHNDAAKGNYNVPMDPVVYQEDPPGNWFEVTYP